jgi:SAM-dependent methyltransferase
MPAGAGYFASRADAHDELARLRLLEDECDPHTFGYLDAIGVDAGWRCLDVGAGAGSLVRWLAERVGPTGHVVAADIDPRFLGDLREPNVEVRRCDITSDAVEQNYYDIIHSRFLLMHMKDPPDVLRRMIGALRPGGWLIAGEPDNDVAGSADPAHPLSGLFDTCYRRRIDFASMARITDFRFGKVLPVCMQAVGLVEMGNEGFVRIFRGGDPFARMWIKTWERIDEAVIANGVLSDWEVAEMRHAYEDPTFTFRAQLTQSVWGRKP